MVGALVVTRSSILSSFRNVTIMADRLAIPPLSRTRHNDSWRRTMYVPLMGGTRCGREEHHLNKQVYYEIKYCKL